MSRNVPFFDELIKLNPNIELVYLDNPYSSAETTGITQLAQVYRALTINNKTWFEVSLLTDSNGDILNTSDKILVQSIISLRKSRTIKNRRFYYLYDEVIATTFVNNDLNNKIILNNINPLNPLDNNPSNNKNPLESASRSALGSGIYGINLSDISEARSLSIDNKVIYEIDLLMAYDIQDKEHGESITTASASTNRYLDRIIFNTNKNDIIGNITQENIIKNDNIENLVILWNIVFYRSGRYISYEKLEDILSNYLIEYFTNHELIDRRTNESLIALPINYIMKEMGYTGLLADDLYNNGWDRGCVSYLFEESDPVIEGKAFY